MQALVRGDVPPAPLNQLLGLQVVDVGDGHAVVVIDAEEQHTNRAHVVHGGVISALCDTAMGAATATTLEEDETYATAQLHVQLIRSASAGSRLECTADVLRRGRRVVAVEAVVHDTADSELVAKATSTCIIGAARPDGLQPA